MRKPLLMILATLVLCGFAAVGYAGDKKIRVVLVDGQNNHQWPLTTPVMKKALEDSGKFTVEISTSTKRNQEKLIPADWKSGPFPPDLSKFDVLLSNYNGEAWPKEMQQSLDERLKAGKIALSIIHAANNSFGGWNEYRQMIGMGWYAANTGDRLLLDDNGKRVIIPKGTGDGPGHRYVGKFSVSVRNADHPITKGMPLEWMHDRDELYDNMRGPLDNLNILATAYSYKDKRGTGAHEPMIWTVSYGKGRVFHSPMGHDANAMKCVGFQTTLLRGTEWAAKGNVTIPIPKNFPTATETSVIK